MRGQRHIELIFDRPEGVALAPTRPMCTNRHYAGLGLRAMRVTEESLREESVLREEVRRAARIVR